MNTKNTNHANTIMLSRIFSREKTLFYFCMWDDSDRMGYRNFLDYSVKNNAFLIPPAGKKGSVWYNVQELDDIQNQVKRAILKDDSFFNAIVKRLDEQWELLFPYVTGEAVIASGDELAEYYTILITWWSAMNTVFMVPDMPEVDSAIKEKVLAYRSSSEKYTEQMNKVFVNFWKEYCKKYEDILFFVTPDEAVAIAKGEHSAADIATIKERKNGCAMVNGRVVLLDTLENVLNESSLVLESVDSKDVVELKGNPAYMVDNVVEGVVRVIYGFDDMADMQDGEILVTEMTNPDYVPIMKQAAAIVTDEGGITCHASIASREMGIPCVVGTKHATSVLQTGDMVRVNTHTGVIEKVGDKEEGFDSVELQNIQTDDYHFYGLWKDDLFAADFWVKYFQKDIFETCGFDMLFGGVLVFNGGHFFAHKQVVHSFNEVVKEDSASGDFSKYDLFYKKAKEAFKDFKTTDFDFEHSRSKTVLVRQWDQFVATAQNLMTYWCGGYILSEAFEFAIADMANAEKVPAEIVPDLLPPVETQYSDQQADLQHMYQWFIDNGHVSVLKGDIETLFAFAHTKPDLWNMLTNHAKTFGWVEMINYIGQPLSQKRVLEQLQSFNPVTHLAQSATYSVSKEFKQLLEVASRIGYVRQAGFEYSSILSYRLYEWLRYVAEVVGLSYRDMLHLTPDEIRSMLCGEIDKEHVQDLIAKRADGNWLVMDDLNGGVCVVSHFDDLQKLQVKMVPRAQEGTTVLVGTAASPGKITAPVSVIMATDDFDSFVPGSVLVTTMTTPDFVVLMQRSKAIVTDIGGLLSHAAIVSRELGVPCVIGTKFATQVLSTGDMVEVDAEKGVVTVLTQ